MEAILYAEIYLFCIVIVWLCKYWSDQRSSNSASERWLHTALVGFLISFISNFLFTLVSRVLPASPVTHHASWLFKTAYHVMLCFGVFAWCGYADTECRGTLFTTRKRVTLSAIPLGLMVALVISNLWTHSLFTITEGGYVRGKLFQLEMGLLVAITTVFSVKLLLHARSETDPIKRGHMKLVSSFPLCLLIAWLLTLAGESFPIISVAITIELLCLYMGTSTQQISMDKLTQVNNRQNLLSFLEYKCVNHSEKLFLFMMDLDYFKTINDTYGHLEGDDALIRASKALKMSCGDHFRRRPYIARYGGDEFIVVIESTRQEADLLLENIHSNLKKLNDEANKPYNLAFSIGVAEYHPGMDANALIEAADSELYKIKRARPGEHKR
ncbi:MAG: GGDEF domain-containing protein [Clostridia bacterium]|nr:GGDEF domain-containing protein [Clostridia bacterium]